ncbi:MAG: recombinase RecT [Thermoplasmata archaeon]
MTLRDEFNVSLEDLRTIRAMLAPGASDGELRLLLATAKRLDLDPIRSQVRFFRTGGDATSRGVVTVGIDGFRAIAEGSGEYAGQDPPKFEVDETGKLVSATVTVYRKGWDHGVSATVFWAEFERTTAKGTGAWDRMPRLMLAKVGEAHALRRAFPRGLSGVYEPSELASPTNFPPSASVRGDHHDAPAAVDGDFKEVPPPSQPAPEPKPAAGPEDPEPRLVELRASIPNMIGALAVQKDREAARQRLSGWLSSHNYETLGQAHNADVPELEQLFASITAA